MQLNNIPEVKLGISRSCFSAALSERRSAALKSAYPGENLFK